MSESEDSKEVDNSVSLPKNRFTTLLHPSLDTDKVKALQEIVRLGRGEVISMKTDFDAETEDESSYKKEKREDSEFSDLKNTMSKTYQNDTEDESSTLEIEDNTNTSPDKIQ